MAEEKWLIESSRVIDLESVRSVKIGLVGGQVDVVGHDEPTTRVEAHSVTGKPLKVSLIDGVLDIDHPQLRWDDWIDAFRTFRGSARAHVSVLVPRDVALRLGVVSASALVSGLRTDASVNTVNGDLVIDGVSGALTANSVGGEIAVRAHSGRVKANSVGGDITVTGAIERLDADTVTGDVFVDASGVPDRIALNTVSGTVTVRLAPDAPARYRVNSMTGRVQLDHAHSTARGSHSGTFGDLDGRWVDFSANTVSGDISVVHSVVA